MKNITHKAEFCVVGGGLAGMSAAIAAARHGVKTVLMHDRPMLGGNASGEIRMWVCGAQGMNKRETGIIEEIQLENNYRNPLSNYSIWDSILYEKVRFEPNITLLLNCTCNELDMDGSRIRAIKGWQLTTETWHRVEAPLFADCSGDSILAPLSGAEFRIGREAREEFGEDIAPEVSDLKTMGMSCEVNVREYSSPQPFIPPEWAHSYLSDDDLPNREHDIRANHFWWVELGGEDDSIHDTEKIRDELLKIIFGIWDHVKNHGDHGADNLVLEWVGFLPGKRESRRYIGDYVMTQNDVSAEGRFQDTVAYGGWPMDDHHPAGINHPGDPTIFHHAPSPFGIPYRSLYSVNIDNLLFAGRNISVTHTAMSSTRVMATCATAGQAVGTAASLAVHHSLSPRGVYEQKVDELKEMLMDDDCWIPWNSRSIPALSQAAEISASEGDPEMVRSGVDRPIDNNMNRLELPAGGWIEYVFERPVIINEVRLVFDSDLNRGIRTTRDPNVLKDTDPAAVTVKEMKCYFALNQEKLKVPECMVKSFRIEVVDEGGNRRTVYNETNNYQRLVRIPVEVKAANVRIVIEESRGAEKVGIFAFDVR
ncbi:FAD-dependent oxidoreductase [Candidatus Latescibacterota bacterium]